MRIIHITDSPEPDAGSVVISLRGLIDALAERGIESATVTRAEAASATRVLRDATVVHLHGWGTAARIMSRAARRVGIPYVIAPLGSLSKGPYHKKGWREVLRGLWRENELVRRAAALAALNAAEQRTLQADHLHDHVRVLPYGLDLSAYEENPGAEVELPAVPQGRCLLVLGPIHPAEGLGPLMQAFAEVGTDADGWNIVIAGPAPGDWRKMLEAAVRRKGGAGQVLFAPAPDAATQRAWLARASVLAAPSLYHRCPVSILQAMAVGVPIIASDRVVPDGLHAAVRVCPPTRPALREALRHVFRLSDEERKSMGHQGRAVCRALFDWSTHADQFVQLYEELIH